MSRKRQFGLFLALCLGLTTMVAAQDWDIEIPSTNTPPVIDGRVDGVWAIASVQYLTITINGSVDSPEDNSASWRVLWDREYLYALVDVNDEALYNDSSNSYQDDSVEFYFDGGNTKGDGAPLSDDDRQYTFGWDTDEIQGTNTDTSGVEQAQLKTETGWRIEMRFPWTTLQGGHPQLGDLIGIDVFYNDDDNGGDSRESQISTFATDAGDWQVPSAWGTGLLVKGSRERASGPSPEDGAVDVLRDALLTWTAGEFAQTHDVYFGTSLEDVNNASRDNPLGVLVSQGQGDTTYDPPGLLEFGQTYYWRIDEVNGAPDNTVFPGEIWSFTAEPFACALGNIVATSNVPSADGDSTPDKTIDGSGLSDTDEHSIQPFDMWLGVPDAGQTAWIQYEFTRVHKMHQMLVWNYNSQFEAALGFGFKDTTVEYSVDGVEWAVLDELEFARATSRSDYTTDILVDFAGVPARYVRLTANSGWGPRGWFGLSEVRFLVIPVEAREPQPADGAAEVDVDAMLGWRTGREAASHEVYFGTEQQAVVDGTALIDTVAANSCVPGALDFGQTYFWRIDEVNETEATNAWEGDLWSFMTREYAIIDDFESYDDDAHRIYQNWEDGWVNDTGSTVGYMDAPFAEQKLVNSGIQSMPLAYDNAESPFYSEAQLPLDSQDWTAGAAETLRLYFRGHPVGFVERADGTIAMGAAGTDIWGAADEFRFAYKRLTGDGTIIARVDSLVNSNEWAKAGVMIRESLTAASRHASVVVTPESGVSFQRRVTAGSDSADTTEAGLAPPYWVKLDRTGDTLTAQRSADGVSWEPITADAEDSTITVNMSGTIYIGLAVTSHDSQIPTLAEFSNITITDGVSGQWESMAIGVDQPANAPDSLYVAIEDASGHTAVLTYPDGEATNVMNWQEWGIPLTDLSAAGVELTAVQMLYIGVGDRNAPQSGGAGIVYIDDIGVGRAAGDQ